MEFLLTPYPPLLVHVVIECPLILHFEHFVTKQERPYVIISSLHFSFVKEIDGLDMETWDRSRCDPEYGNTGCGVFKRGIQN